MLARARIMIVEDAEELAEGLAEAVRRAEGRIIGPLDSVEDALDFLNTERIDAAILDTELVDRDVTPVARQLMIRKIPFVLYTDGALPNELETCDPALPVFEKSAALSRLIQSLAIMLRNRWRGSGTGQS